MRTRTALKEEVELKSEQALASARAACENLASFIPQYGMVDLKCLLELVNDVRNGCSGSNCGGSLMVIAVKWDGHCVGLTLQCSSCGNADMWWSSKRYNDNSFQINRDVVRAWFCTGGESGKYQDFATELRAGVYNRKSFDVTIKLMIPIILTMEDQLYFQNVNQTNLELESGTIIGFDVQHSRPQRSFGPASLASGTFICHNPGKFYGKILLQVHTNTRELKENGGSGTESKDKIVITRGLEKLAKECYHILRGITDGSGSGQKAFKDLVISKHPQATLSFCNWHKCKNLTKDFKTKLFDRRTKLAIKQGNKQYQHTYGDLRELDISPATIKGKWIYAQQSSGGNVEEMRDEFMSLVDFYQTLYENYLSEKTVEDLDEWLDNQTKDLDKYIHGDLTDLEESFHKTSLKFWKKGVGYDSDTYYAKRALAALYWNENFGKKKVEKGRQFQQDIATKLYEYLNMRTKGNNADNEYVATKYQMSLHWN